MNPDTKKIDLLIQYIASVAAQEEWPSRELGAIHISDHVYQTEPMLRAAPGENLDLLPAVHESISEFEAESSAPLTKRQIKKRKENLSDLKRRLSEKLEAKKNRKRLIPTPPRYDEVFFQGLECLDTLAGDPIETMDGTLTISEEIWKSKARYDPDSLPQSSRSRNTSL